MMCVCMHAFVCVCIQMYMAYGFISTSCDLIQYYTPVTLNGQNVLDHFSIVVMYAPLFVL